jgi:hypothetical protein
MKAAPIGIRDDSNILLAYNMVLPDRLRIYLCEHSIRDTDAYILLPLYVNR